MGVIDIISNFFHHSDDEKEEKVVIDLDEDGKQLFREDIISFVDNELEQRRMDRLPLEMQWRLNANWLSGNQFCEYNRYTGEVEQIEPAYDWMEREAYNQIAPLTETRVANLKKINYSMRVNPATNELSDYEKAEISTSILKHLQHSTDFNDEKNISIQWNEVTGNCFFLSWWNPNKGRKIAHEAIIKYDDDGTKKKTEKAYYEGDIDYGLLTPYEVYPESIFKETVSEQRSIIIEQVKTVDEIYDLYNIRVDGSDIQTFSLTPVMGGSGYGFESSAFSLGTRAARKSERVITYFEKPTKHRPNGRMIIIVGDDNLIYYGALPYKRIPIVQEKCIGVSGQFFGKSVIENLIPRQRAYNGCVNRIHEYIKRIAIQGYMAEEDSIDIDSFEENGAAPGAIMEYARGTNVPVPIQNGNLPSEVMNERQYLKNEMEYVAGVSQLMVNGATPSGITSGTAINNLMEIDNIRLSLTGDYIRNAVRDLAKLWLEIYKQYADAPRVMQLTGKNSIGSVITWNKQDINSFDIEYTTENELLMSEENQKQNFIEAFRMGLFADESGKVSEGTKADAVEFMRCGKYSEIMGINTLHKQKAQRENTLFGEGVVPRVWEFDDHNAHLSEHMRYMLQIDFNILKHKKPEYAKAFEDHVRIHQQLTVNNGQSAMNN